MWAGELDRLAELAEQAEHGGPTEAGATPASP